MGRGASRGRNGTATALVRRVKPNTDTQEIQGALATQQEIHKQVIQWGDLIPPLLMSKIDQFEAIVCGDSNFGLMDFKILAADIKRAVCELQMNSQASDLQAEELAQNGDAEESYAVSLVEEVDIPLHSIASASNTSHNDVSGDPQISYATLPTLEAEDDDFAGVVVSPNEEMQYITKLKIAEVKSRKQFIEQKIEGLYESERESMQYFRDISHHITGMKKLIGALSSSSTKKEELTRQKLKLEEESKNIESKINDSTKHHEELEDEAKCLAIQISALEHVSAKEAYESSHRTYIDCAKHYVEIYKQKQSSLMKQKERHEFQLKKNLSLALMQADIDLAREQKLYNEQFYVELV